MQPHTIQAVDVRCGTTGLCLLRERPVKIAEKGLRLHNAVATLKAKQDFRIDLTNITSRAVHLPKNYAVGLAEPHVGPVYTLAEEDRGSSLGEGAGPGGPRGDPAGPRGAAGEDAGVRGPTRDANGASKSGPTNTDQDRPTPRVAYELIPPSLHGAVRDLLERYQGLWSGQLGQIDVTPHRINLQPGARPIRSQPYREGPHHRELIEKEVGRQLKLGVVEPSQAEWSFPVVLVPKPDGSPRFCVDYRRLNEITVRDSYPLPRMDDCLDFLGDAMVFSTLDCNAGYWQIPVATEDQDKTTFTCHAGTYKYIRLPFGLTNAPATFQRAIYMLLAGVKWRTCLVYLDDVVVFSPSAEQHLRDLEEVFQLLDRGGVSLKAAKCFLFQDQVEYLGHVVGKGELRVNNKNLVGLQQAQTPRTKRHLRSFLGMCNVYRRFVQDYADIARPLLALTSTKVVDPLPPFTEEQQRAFVTLKDRLTHTPVLALPRKTGKFLVDTDASATQLGAVLIQEQPDGTYRPVGCWSRILKGAERNYSTT